MKTAVVILNWNTRDYLEHWLPGITASCEGRDAGVFVADSGSGDGSLELLQARFPQVRPIPLGKNFGFAEGYNRALSRIHADYFVLLNSDVDVAEDWLDALTEYMDSHPDCGICGPKLLALTANGERTQRFEYAGAAGGYLDRYGYPFCRGRVLKRTETDRGQYDGTGRDVLWVSGAALMTRRTLWEHLGGLEADFFAHMEEIDYCWRACLQGWRVCLVPAAKVWHLGGGTLPQGNPDKLRLNFRNNLLLLERNLPGTIGAPRARARILVRKILDGGAALCFLLAGRTKDFRAVWQAHREYRQLRGKKPVPAGQHPVRGYWKGCILPAALLQGQHIFAYIRKKDL
ncbi:MAG: glycosyltransferase family 2 protein [Bacteroidales bacterium]|nr:glycosyltransferase family 2 protein [Bacteroidales bacterium]